MMHKRVAQHRPATKRRRFRHDDLVAVDLFSGFGGLTEGIRRAGFTTIMAANHNQYKVEVHEANHPYAEHWIADLINPESSDYHSARDLPPADLLVAGVTCTNHSQANTQRAYEQRLSLFDLEDPDYEDAVTRSERDRATANCVLHYAAEHHPRMILVECTTELTSWGYQVPGKKKMGDGTTYRWWLNQFDVLGYRHRVLYLNSMFFGVPQSRDRLYIVFWDKAIPAPDLDHKPLTHCPACDDTVEAQWTWKTGIPPSGSVRYGKQYNYRCPRCYGEVVPPFAPSINTLDLSDLGTKIGDRDKPLAAATMARAERCRQRFADFPAVILPFVRRGEKASSGRHPWQPLPTATGQQEQALLSAGQAMLMPAKATRGAERHPSEALPTQTSQQELAVLSIANFQGAARGVDEALPVQAGSETLGILSAGVLPYRKNTQPTTHAEAMPTVTAEQIPGLFSAAGLIQQNEGTDRRVFGTDDPMRTVTANNQFALLTSGWADQWRDELANTPLEECYFRMLAVHEIGRGCGFDVNFGDYRGEFKVWGSNRDQVDGFGNAVSPPVGHWIGNRLRQALHAMERAA